MDPGWAADVEHLKQRYIADGRAWAALGQGRALHLGAAGVGPDLARHVVLVEGYSDLAAVEAMAAQAHVDLAAGAVAIVSTGGITNISYALSWLGDRPQHVRICGLCDVADAHQVTAAGFAVCDPDLEGELIRAAGTDAVRDVIVDHGEGRSLQAFRRMPSQRGVPLDDGLRRFMGTRSGRKICYARALVDHLGPARLPEPLRQLRTHLADGV